MAAHQEPTGARRWAVLVVDDDEDFRAYMAALLAEAGHLPRQVGTGELAIAETRAEPPDLVILDVRLPGTSGYSVCRTIRDEIGETLPILFVSGERVEAFDRVAGLLLGGDDYLVKPFAPDELLARLNSLMRRVPGQANGHNGQAQKLTPRELEVLALLASGLRQPEIAKMLVISTRTVGRHIEHILEKLGVHTRAQAVAFAYQHDLIDSAG